MRPPLLMFADSPHEDRRIGLPRLQLWIAIPGQDGPGGLLRIEDCLDAAGGVVPPPGVNLISLIDRNIANVGDTVAYRYLDYSRSADGDADEVTWSRFGVRLEAIGARVQQAASRGERVAVLAPQGIDYVAGFYAAVKAGTIAVPLFAPELPGHAERLDTALRDSEPTVVLTTTPAREAVEKFLDVHPHLRRPQVIAIDEIPDSAGESFEPTELGMDDVSHLQYTSGSTRPPVGVEITHRAVGTNLVQMILSIDLLDRNTHGVSWLPLYHDMGLSMIGFPAVYGGHSTLMSPTAFVRRPQRWIQALSDGSRQGNVVTAAPNFAYEWAAQRGLPSRGEDIDLRNVVMIIGSEPVSIDAIRTFNKAFAPYGLPRTAFKPSYGIAEATLFVATIAPAPRRRRCTSTGSGWRAGQRCASTRIPPTPSHRCRAARSRAANGPSSSTPPPRIRVAGRRGGRNLVAGQQRRPRLLGPAGRNAAGVRRRAAIAARRRQPRGGRRSGPRLGCAPATWACISTVSCTSPAGSRTW